MKIIDINSLKPPEQEVAIFQGAKHGANVSFFIVIIPAGSWHEFKNRSDKIAFMVNIHPVAEMITEWAQV